MEHDTGISQNTVSISGRAGLITKKNATGCTGALQKREISLELQTCYFGLTRRRRNILSVFLPVSVRTVGAFGITGGVYLVALLELYLSMRGSFFVKLYKSLKS